MSKSMFFACFDLVFLQNTSEQGVCTLCRQQALVGAVNQTALVVKNMSAQFAAQHNGGSYTPISAAIGLSDFIGDR